MERCQAEPKPRKLPHCFPRTLNVPSAETAFLIHITSNSSRTSSISVSLFSVQQTFKELELISTPVTYSEPCHCRLHLLPSDRITPSTSTMSLRRLIPRIPVCASSTRTFTTGTAALAARAPSISDIEPDKSHTFVERQKAWRKQQAETHAKQKEDESKLYSLESKSNMTDLYAEVTSQSKNTKDKKGGPLSSLIYGTKEGQEMDEEIERSFSQVLARGKYVHSIVQHQVKPDKVDEYVELVGKWYPKVAGTPENKVHLVGSWRTEVGDCDTFGMFGTALVRPVNLTISSSYLGISAIPRIPRLAPLNPAPPRVHRVRSQTQVNDRF